MSMKQQLTCLGALVAGVAAGLAIGLLAAPNSGEVTRRRIGWKLDEGQRSLRRRGQRILEDTASRLGRDLGTAKHKLDDARRELQQTLTS
jgi:gas vesicle protein